jgi:hypothetical protein
MRVISDFVVNIATRPDDLRGSHPRRHNNGVSDGFFDCALMVVDAVAIRHLRYRNHYTPLDGRNRNYPAHYYSSARNHLGNCFAHNYHHRYHHRNLQHNFLGRRHLAAAVVTTAHNRHRPRHYTWLVVISLIWNVVVTVAHSHPRPIIIPGLS